MTTMTEPMRWQAQMIGGPDDAMAVDPAGAGGDCLPALVVAGGVSAGHDATSRVIRIVDRVDTWLLFEDLFAGCAPSTAGGRRAAGRRAR